MPTEPTVRAVHINRPMTNMSIAIMNDPNEFVGYFVAPRLSVRNWSDSYFIYTSADFLRDDMQPRAPGGLYPEVGYGLSTGTYQCHEWALATDVPDEVRDNADSPLDPDADAASLLAQKILLAHERRVAALATATATITQNTTLSGTGQWTDYANSDPIANIWTGRKTIRRATLRKPNRMVMGAVVWEDTLVNHPAFIERIKYTQRADPGSMLGAVAALFMVDEIRMSGAIYNSANKGATASYSDIWSDDLLLFHSANSPSLRQPSFMFTIEAGGGLQITTKRDDLRDRDVHRTKHITAEKVVVDTCAYLIKDINA